MTTTTTLPTLEALYAIAPKDLRKGERVFAAGAEWHGIGYGEPMICLSRRGVVGAMGKKQGWIAAEGSPSRERAYRNEDGSVRCHGLLFRAGQEADVLPLLRDHLRASILRVIELCEKRIERYADDASAVARGYVDSERKCVEAARAYVAAEAWTTAPIFVLDFEPGQPKSDEDDAAYLEWLGFERLGLEAKAYAFHAESEARRARREGR